MVRIGAIMWDITDKKLKFIRQLGVTDILVTFKKMRRIDHYDLRRLQAVKEKVETAGLKVAAVHGVPSRWYEKLRYGLPGRDREIENFERSIAAVGAAGIPVWGYQFHSLRVWRTSRTTPGRGGAHVTSYDHDLVAEMPPARQKPIGENEMWENFHYFLERVIPAAERAGVKMALHPDDPPTSPIAGFGCPFRSVEAFQRVIDLVPSEANGMIFCQGCFTEMGIDVYEAIRHFGKQKKIFYVHFRNVAGAVPSFRETFIDEGDVDMYRAMKTYKEIGYDGLFVPDHVPRIEGDTNYQHRSRAYAVGYIRALMHVVNSRHENRSLRTQREVDS